MPGKSKDCKANKGRKALENEWEEAVKAAETGDPLIASSVNILKKGDAGSSSGVYVAQAGGGSAKDRLRKYEEALERAEREQQLVQHEMDALKLQNEGSDAAGLSEKEALKLKKKKEKEDKKAFEAKQEEERLRRAKAREDKLKSDDDV
jgi:hypothetical protein